MPCVGSVVGLGGTPQGRDGSRLSRPLQGWRDGGGTLGQGARAVWHIVGIPDPPLVAPIPPVHATKVHRHVQLSQGRRALGGARQATRTAALGVDQVVPGVQGRAQLNAAQ